MTRLVHALGFAAAALLVWGCESRQTPRMPGAMERNSEVRMVELQPGVPLPSESMYFPYDDDPYAIAEGKRLYGWYNCSGCHFAGGGGIGPALMDDAWIYGSEPENILDTIMEGRPDGMPSYRGKLPQDDAMKIIAYVRSLGRDAQAKPQRQQNVTEDTTVERTPAIEQSEGERDAGSQ